RALRCAKLCAERRAEPESKTAADADADQAPGFLEQELIGRDAELADDDPALGQSLPHAFADPVVADRFRVPRRREPFLAPAALLLLDAGDLRAARVEHGLVRALELQRVGEEPER